MPDALGPDAVILANRPVDGVVEILALATDDVASMASSAAGTEMAQPSQLPSPSLHTLTRSNPTPAAAPPAPKPAPPEFDMAYMSTICRPQSPTPRTARPPECRA